MNTATHPRRPNIAPRRSPRFNLKKVPQRPLLALVIALILGIVAYLVYASIYAAATYQCQTENIGGLPKCHKYQVSPSFKDLGIVLDTACPINPPSNCP